MEQEKNTQTLKKDKEQTTSHSSLFCSKNKTKSNKICWNVRQTKKQSTLKSTKMFFRKTEML